MRSFVSDAFPVFWYYTRFLLCVYFFLVWFLCCIYSVYLKRARFFFCFLYCALFCEVAAYFFHGMAYILMHYIRRIPWHLLWWRRVCACPEVLCLIFFCYNFFYAYYTLTQGSVCKCYCTKFLYYCCYSKRESILQ